LIAFLEKKSQKNVKIRVCVPDRPEDAEDIGQFQSNFTGTHIELFVTQKPYLHAKVMVIDRKVAIVTSANFTENALDRNREVGLIFEPTKQQIYDIESLFMTECHRL
jgi:cardiolipin synthase A/B